jgi:hypothetical protein
MTTRFLKLCIWAFTAIFLTNCNNSGDSKKTDDTTTVNNVDTTAKTGAGPVIYCVRITADNFKAAFDPGTDPNDVKMLRFEFEQKYEGFTLKMVGCKADGTPVGNYVSLDTVARGNTISINTPGDPNYVEVVTRGDFKFFFGLRTGTNSPIDSKDFKEVWLTPCRPTTTNTNIAYMISLPSDPAPQCLGIGGAKQTEIYSNPSPPARPSCDAGCDNPPDTKTKDK